MTFLSCSNRITVGQVYHTDWLVNARTGPDWLVGLVKETSAMEKVDNQYPLVLCSFLHNLHNQGIFLDGKLADLV